LQISQAKQQLEELIVLRSGTRIAVLGKRLQDEIGVRKQPVEDARF
jgi:hypothetical protein